MTIQATLMGVAVATALLGIPAVHASTPTAGTLSLAAPSTTTTTAKTFAADPDLIRGGHYDGEGAIAASSDRRPMTLARNDHGAHEGAAHEGAMHDAAAHEGAMHDIAEHRGHAHLDAAHLDHMHLGTVHQ